MNLPVNDARVATVAAGLVAAHRSQSAWAPPAFDPALTMEEGYRVQDAVAAQLGWFGGGRPTAWKAGGKALVTAAPLPLVLASGASWSPGAAHGVLMEAEIAFRFARTPASRDEVMACIGTMCVSIEMVGTRLVGGQQAPAPWKLADQQMHAVLVAGAERPYEARDWTQQSCLVRIDGKVIADRIGGHPNDNAVEPLPWLWEHAQQRGIGLRAGDLVTTGAWVIAPVTTGARIEVEFAGIGAASLTFAA